jgi:signal transduction histidine kinase
MKPKHSWMSIDELVQDARERARVQLAGKPVFFLAQNQLPGRALLSDPMVVRGVLRTLLANAAKHTEIGKLTLRITWDSYTVRFALHDTGDGISAEKQEESLRPRHCFGPELARRLGDADLGLPLSRYLAGLLGGDLTVISKPATGSVFTLALPAVDGLGNELVRRYRPRLHEQNRRRLAA